MYPWPTHVDIWQKPSQCGNYALIKNKNEETRKKKKEAERQKIDAFELWCWTRLLRVPWTARRSNQSILKESVLGDHWKA